MAKSLRSSPTHKYDLLVASVEGVANRWRSQYTEADRVLMCGKSVKEIQDALDKLEDDANPDLADEIIGNKGWTHPSCACCGEHVKAAVQFGDYSESVMVCEPCLMFTANALRKAIA